VSELGDHRTRISVRLLEPKRALTTLRLSAPFTRMSLFRLLGAGSGSSTIRSPFVILSHSLARLERIRSNLPPGGGVEIGGGSAVPFWRVSVAALRLRDLGELG
jgi:hypothetical protein